MINVTNPIKRASEIAKATQYPTENRIVLKYFQGGGNYSETRCERAYFKWNALYIITILNSSENPKQILCIMFCTKTQKFLDVCRY